MTQSQENIHYRTGGKLTHCGVECLPNGADIPRIIIESIEFKDREMINGRSEEGVWVAHFAPNPYTKLPLILNATNRKRIVKLYPECDGYLARLHNIAVRLTKEKCRDVQDGGETWGLRISKQPADAETAPQLKPLTEDRIPAAVKWMQENGKGIEDVKNIYLLAPDIEEKLIAALDDLPV